MRCRVQPRNGSVRLQQVSIFEGSLTKVLPHHSRPCILQRCLFVLKKDLDPRLLTFKFERQGIWESSTLWVVLRLLPAWRRGAATPR